MIAPSLGQQKLVQEIDCSLPNKDMLFMEYPRGQQGADDPRHALPHAVQQGGRVKVLRLPHRRRQRAKGRRIVHAARGLSRGSRPHHIIMNWGCETSMGFATGQSIGDVLKGKYVPDNPESLNYPLSGKMQTWSQYFHLHDRFPEIKRPARPGHARPLTPEDGF